ncbi:PDR/VanB family oxidoreductase [Denitromonas iodatirespirans]|uniref:Oxidoreductase n=1 Tax=Denitromonas iodatirespirans TaxID=2795389 RepID=A0A944DA01_DENI1|nr:PDR/VanB family oxidoreductase [Denitromonas iodatirespirans]MBT0962955.1 oxidoreductase [Denitromonas iodatirespirans]
MSETLLTVRVAARQAETAEVSTFELVAADGGALPAFAAGAHLDVHVPGGLVRQYSLCNAPSETHRYLIGVLRDPNSRGGSAAMHDAVQAGDTLQISAPRNHFALDENAGHHLLLAGGIGVTPILCMAEALAAGAGSFDLHYCARSADRMAFRTRLAGAAFADRVLLHLDDGDAAQKLDIAATLAEASPQTHLYVCGPAGFIEAVLDTARAQGWAEARLHREFFAAPVHDDEGDSGAFEMALAQTGITVQVAAGQSAVAALHAAGVDVPVSCEQGVCGTCLTRVLEGTPDHRDAYLTEDERAANDQFLPCCSRARGRLVIDL